MNQSPGQGRFEDADFGDVFHLNEQGAAKLSRLLAERYAQYQRATDSLIR